MSNTDAVESHDSLINKDDTRQYWNGVDADVNGMLGGVPSLHGFSSISKIDLQGSRNFLAKLGIGVKNGQRRVSSALEAGAGIGRVTEGLLVDIADQVDIIEPVVKFTNVLQGKSGVRNIFNIGLEEWQPLQETQYDLVWAQWCVGYLTDKQLVQHLERCKEALVQDSGIIVIKENLSTSGQDYFDPSDSSITREDVKFRSIFKLAGLQIIKTEIQRGFPQNAGKLLPVRMYALKPNLEAKV